MAECIHSLDIFDWEIETDEGWADITQIHKTVEYIEWILVTNTGHQLICADTHIVFDENYQEIFVKYIIPNKTKIITKDGPELVIYCQETENSSNMYDISIDSDTHRYWSSSILSHNSTVVAGYVSWYISFNDHKTAAILANKQLIAKEIFSKVQFIIENLPIWLQQGIEEWNKTSLTLENGSRCLCAATSPSAVRGMSCVTGDTKICLSDEYNNIYYDTITNFLSWKHCVNYYGHEYYVNVHDIENLIPIGKKFIQLSSSSCKILTEKGFRTFTGIIKHPESDILLLTTNKSSLKCTGDHRILLPSGSYIEAEYLKIGDKLYNNHIVTDIKYDIPAKVYDILDVEETNSYYSNGLVSHNCNLLVLDEFAHLKSNLADEFISSVFPTLSSSEQSKLVIISCVTKDTYVFSDKGIKQVSDFIDTNQIVNPNIGYKVSPYKIAGLNQINSGNIMVNSGKSNTRIITSKSTQLECSTNHKLWACKNGVYNWYESRNLEEGDYISINYGQNIWGNNDIISDDITMTSTLGYILGLDIISEYPSSIIAPFFNYPTIIPTRILECSKEVLSNVIAGIFFYSGHITQNGTIVFRNLPSALTKQIRIILLNIGITTELSKKNILINTFEECELFHKNITQRKYYVNNLDHIEITETNIKWEKITSIKESENEVFDFSLNHIEDDFWCHSIIYNGIVGHQTPNGLNHYHKLWMDAKNGLNDFVTVEAHWSEHPKRTIEWAEKERKKLGDIRYQTEIECIWAHSMITVRNDETNDISYTSIGNFYELIFKFQDNNFENDCGYSILTPSGWCKFSGINKKNHKKTYTISLSSGRKFIASPNHLCQLSDSSYKLVKELTDNDILMFNTGINSCSFINNKNNKTRIVNIEKSSEYDLYDVINVNNNEHNFIADNLVHHNCVFAGSSYALINGIKLAELPTVLPQFSNNNLEIYYIPEKEHNYVISVDTSRGRHHDYSALSIIDITTVPYSIVGIYKDNTISVLEFPHLIYNLAKQYNDAYILIETNDLGESVSNSIWFEYEYDNIYFTNKQKLSDSVGFPGVRTTSSVKSLGCSVLKELIEQNQLILNSHKIIEELGIFVKKGKSYGADDITINDDLTTTLWLFAWLTKQDIFANIVNVNIRELLSANKQKYIDDNMTPYGFYDNGITERIEEIGEKNRILPTGEESYYLTEDQLELLNF